MRITGYRLRALLVGVAVVSLIGVAGCSWEFEEKICAENEYPVKAINSPTGSACVTEGEEPPDGYVRHPEGKVPETVGDKWDEYWEGKVLDENGEIVED